MKNEVRVVIEEGTVNQRFARCIAPDCGCELPAGTGKAIFIPSKGIRYVCDRHFGDNGLLGYHGNARRLQMNDNGALGTPKKTALAQTTISVEFETYTPSAHTARYTAVRNILESCFDCKAESDCTVTWENPSHYCAGLAKFSKVLQRMDLQGELAYFDNEKCGAHIHAGADDVRYLRRYYHSIFVPLSDYIVSLPRAKRIEYFGRDFAEWAQPIRHGCNVENHTNVFNMQHEATVEFRLPRITGFNQYMKVLKFWRQCMCEVNHFEFNKDADSATRKASADRCAEKLVKIAKKYFPAQVVLALVNKIVKRGICPAGRMVEYDLHGF